MGKCTGVLLWVFCITILFNLLKVYILFGESRRNGKGREEGVKEKEAERETWRQRINRNIILAGLRRRNLKEKRGNLYLWTQILNNFWCFLVTGILWSRWRWWQEQLDILKGGNKQINKIFSPIAWAVNYWNVKCIISNE